MSDTRTDSAQKMPTRDIDVLVAERTAIEAQLRALLEQAPDGIFLADLEGRYTDVNAAGCRMLGYSRDELVGTAIVDLLPEEDVPRLWDSREQLLAGATDLGEWRLRRKDGSYLPVEVSAKILDDGRWQGIVRDISQRKRLETVVRETVDDLNRAQSVARIGSWRLDVVRNELAWSKESYRIFGAPVGVPLTYESFLSCVHPEDREFVDREWKAALRGEPYDIEHRVVVDGAVRWVREKADLAFGADGELRGGIGITQDITERKEAEAALRDGELRYRALFDRSIDALLLTAPDGRIVMANAATTELFGYTEDELRALGRHAIVDVDDPRLAAGLEERRRTGRFRGELTMKTKTGERVPVEVSSAIFRDEKGSEWTSMLIRDVRERKRAEEAVAESERLLSGIFEIVPVGLLIADRTGRFVRMNPAAVQIWDGERVGESELGEYDAFSVETGERLRPEEWPLSRALEGETAVGRVIRIRTFGGVDKTIVASALPLHDQRGELTAAIVVNEDITELKRTEEALRRAVQDREKLLAVVAHDLRSPLSTAYMAAGLLLETIADESERTLVESLRRSLQQTNRLIDDLLDAATLETGRLSIERALVPAADVVREAVESLRAHASEASLDLAFEAPSNLPAVCADQGRLLQILSNLIVNAIKFTPPGGRVRVEARRCEEGVRFSVADTGPGIPPADAAHLFEAFWQARRADRRGAGLGLAIVKDLVELHGGRIWFDSTPGAGTTFHFTLPIACAEVRTRDHAAE